LFQRKLHLTVFIRPRHATRLPWDVAWMAESGDIFRENANARGIHEVAKAALHLATTAG